MNFILLPSVVLFMMMGALVIVLKRNVLIVKAESDRYHKMLCLNEEQQFHNISAPCYRFTSQCNSKKKFDKLNLDEYMMYIIEHNERNIANIINKVEDNNERYHIYCNEVANLKSITSDSIAKECMMTDRGFKRLENKICKSIKLQPRLKINILLCAQYESPKGKNLYEKHRTYSYDKIIEMYMKTRQKVSLRDSFEQQKKKERSKMTDSLRYDILRRDGFRCKICGITAAEGAKLHVDHIMPIAKGGKTVNDNLQTLCDRCNYGKSDKYEPPITDEEKIAQFVRGELERINKERETTRLLEEKAAEFERKEIKVNHAVEITQKHTEKLPTLTQVHKVNPEIIVQKIATQKPSSRRIIGSGTNCKPVNKSCESKVIALDKKVAVTSVVIGTESATPVLEKAKASEDTGRRLIHKRTD